MNFSRQEERLMGKGDKRTRRGKIFKGSYGKTRSHNPAPKKPRKTPAGRAGRS
jgi:ribosomal small subunit protein bTHX